MKIPDEWTTIQKIEYVSKKLAALYEFLEWEWTPGGGDHTFIPDKHEISNLIIGYIKELKHDPIGTLRGTGGIEITKQYFDDEPDAPIVYNITLDLLMLNQDDIKDIS